MATQQSISLYRGTEMTLNFTMSPVVDITGWTILFTIAKALNSPNKLLSRAATITDGPLGKYSVALDADDTINVKPGSYFFDTWRTDADEESVLSIGSFVVLPVARLPV